MWSQGWGSQRVAAVHPPGDILADPSAWEQGRGELLPSRGRGAGTGAGSCALGFIQRCGADVWGPPSPALPMLLAAPLALFAGHERMQIPLPSASLDCREHHRHPPFTQALSHPELLALLIATPYSCLLDPLHLQKEKWNNPGPPLGRGDALGLGAPRWSPSEIWVQGGGPLHRTSRGMGGDQRGPCSAAGEGSRAPQTGLVMKED